MCCLHSTASLYPPIQFPQNTRLYKIIEKLHAASCLLNLTSAFKKAEEQSYKVGNPHSLVSHRVQCWVLDCSPPILSSYGEVISLHGFFYTTALLPTLMLLHGSQNVWLTFHNGEQLIIPGEDLVMPL